MSFSHCSNDSTVNQLLRRRFGGAVNAAVALVTFAMSKGQTEALLRNINQSLFALRGLKVKIARLDALAKLAVNIDPFASVSNGTK
ncbi:hypothetical protein AB5N19_03541 [Seiridium cardinale]